MKKIVLFCVAMCAIATQFLAQDTATTYENSLLWKISGNDLKENSYLYGTIHVGDARVFDYGEPLKEAIKEVDAVYGEIDMTDIAAQMKAMSRMMMDKNLPDMVSEKEYALIQEQAKGNPVSMMMNRIKPFFTMAELTRVLIPSDSATVLDMHLQQLALSLGKEVGGIETLDEQLDAVDKISLEDQVKMLVEFCEEFEEQKADLMSLLDMYLARDLNGMWKLSKESMDEGDYGKDFEMSLLTDRNTVMVERLMKKMPDHSLVFAVGTLHLPGEDGLIDLLRAEGYTVEAVMGH
ncbi:MAG: TraB/GumN family protein [Flavobacteriales bacterium]